MHRIHAELLRACAARADRLRVGVGSAGREDARNPFDLELRLAMLRAVLAELPPRDVELIPLPDLHDGPRWAELVARRLGPLDRFVSANGYVRRLLGERYRLAHPRELIPPAARAPISGSAVRAALARGEPWEHLVPPPVAALLRGVPAETFRRRYGDDPLNQARLDAPQREESAHVRVG